MGVVLIFVFVFFFVLIYMVFVLFFNFLIYFFIIMVLVLFLFIGVFLVFKVLGWLFDMLGGIGLFVFMGFVMKNGILFIDYVN